MYMGCLVSFLEAGARGAFALALFAFFAMLLVAEVAKIQV